MSSTRIHSSKYGKKLLLLVISILLFCSHTQAQPCPFTRADFANGGSFAGDCTLNAGGNIWVSGNVEVTSGEIVISQGAVIFPNSSSLTIRNGASLRVDDNLFATLGPVTIDTGGTLESHWHAFLFGPVTVSGTLTMLGSSRYIETRHRNVTIRTGGLMHSAGDLVVTRNGTLTIDAGATVTVTGEFTNNRSGTPRQGTIMLDGTMDVGTTFRMMDTSPDSGLMGCGSLTVNSSYTNQELSDFSGCGMGVTCIGSGCPLPVEFLFFTAQYENRSVLLEWATATEITNSHFEVERSSDGIDFAKIGEVSGAGDSQQRIDYHYLDHEAAVADEALYYRLKQVDFDGQFEYSNTEVARNDHFQPFEWLVRPTRFTSKVTITLNSPQEETVVAIRIFDLTGSEVFFGRNIIFEGINDIDIERLDYLAPGTYIINMIGHSFNLHTKIIKRH